MQLGTLTSPCLQCIDRNGIHGKKGINICSVWCNWKKQLHLHVQSERPGKINKVTQSEVQHILGIYTYRLQPAPCS